MIRTNIFTRFATCRHCGKQIHRREAGDVAEEWKHGTLDVRCATVTFAQPK